jgi:hypothetical protein
MGTKEIVLIVGALVTIFAGYLIIKNLMNIPQAQSIDQLSKSITDFD